MNPSTETSGKPADIPQDVWDRAEVVAREATRDAMRDPLMPYYITVAPHIARAILAAKAEEREAIAAFCAEQAPTIVGELFAAAIRKRGGE